MKELSGFVDAMADEAAKKYPGRGLDLAILPETIVTTLHGPASKRAIPLEGPVLETLRLPGSPAQTYLIVPFDLSEESVSGPVYFNSAVLLDRRGTVAGIYRKVHPVAGPHDALENGITPGSEFPVFECDFGKLGIQICWDFAFDDGWQALAEKGAELVVLPSQITGDRPAGCTRGPASLLHRVQLLEEQLHGLRADRMVAAKVETPGKPLVHRA